MKDEKSQEQRKALVKELSVVIKKREKLKESILLLISLDKKSYNYASISEKREKIVEVLLTERITELGLDSLGGTEELNLLFHKVAYINNIFDKLYGFYLNRFGEATPFFGIFMMQLCAKLFSHNSNVYLRLSLQKMAPRTPIDNGIDVHFKFTINEMLELTEAQIETFNESFEMLKTHNIFVQINRTFYRAIKIGNSYNYRGGNQEVNGNGKDFLQYIQSVYLQS